MTMEMEGIIQLSLLGEIKVIGKYQESLASLGSLKNRNNDGHRLYFRTTLVSHKVKPVGVLIRSQNIVEREIWLLPL